MGRGGDRSRGGLVRPVAVVHAGAGKLSSELRENEDRCRAVLLEVLDNARMMLDAGRAALETAKTLVQIMEDCDLFNAGYGSALCSDGSVRMSAAVMRGSDRAAGAVAGIKIVKHPVIAAYAVLHSHQVLMIGEDADTLAIAAGAERMANEHFVTDRQRTRLAQQAEDGDHGTVGAVCLDHQGVLAAATSTGGLTGQPPGRVGDSPLIGAGTWADQSVAVSCTGDGEAFIRGGTARRLATLVERGASLRSAANDALVDVSDLGGRGGLIALDSAGHAVMPFTADAMPRGYWRANEEPRVCVMEAEDLPPS
jgi:L-asparaginase / beta-aspartyl-peptidase